MVSIDISDGDMVIKDKRLQTVSNLEQKMQKTRGIIQTVLGELFYNANIGLKYSEILDIKEKGISDERKKVAIIEAVNQDQNVEKVNWITISTNQSSRTVYIDLQLKYKDEDSSVEIRGVRID